MRVYCQKCGQPTEYSVQGGKPKFCSHCGLSYGVSEYRLDAVKGNAPVPKGAPKEHTPAQLEEEFPDDAIYIPDISKLQVDIDTTHERPAQMTIGDLAGSKIDGFIKEEPRLPTPESDMSSEEFLRSFQKEAGSLRPKRSDNG